MFSYYLFKDIVYDYLSQFERRSVLTKFCADDIMSHFALNFKSCDKLCDHQCDKQLLKFSAKCDIMSSAQNLVSTEQCFKLSQVIIHNIFE
jgi:hypothetical protein